MSLIENYCNYTAEIFKSNNRYQNILNEKLLNVDLSTARVNFIKYLNNQSIRKSFDLKYKNDLNETINEETCPGIYHYIDKSLAILGYKFEDSEDEIQIELDIDNSNNENNEIELDIENSGNSNKNDKIELDIDKSINEEIIEISPSNNAGNELLEIINQASNNNNKTDGDNINQNSELILKNINNKTTKKVANSAAPKLTKIQEKKLLELKNCNLVDSTRINFDLFNADFRNAVNKILDKINEIVKSGLPEFPTGFKTTVKNLSSESFISGKILEVKFSSKMMSVKYEITYLLNDHGDTRTISRKADYKKDNKNKLTDFEKEFNSLAEDYFTYVDEFKKSLKSIDICSNEQLLNSDLVYDISNMVIKTNDNSPLIYDSSLGIIYNKEYKLGFSIVSSDNYKYRRRDYSLLFNSLRNNNAAWNLTKNKVCCKEIFRVRYASVYHPMYKDSLVSYWQKCQESIEKIENPSLITNKWKLILNSPKCFNVICKGYPISSLFENSLLKLIPEIDSIKLLLNELYLISPIFSPYGIYLEGINPEFKVVKSKTGWSKKFIDYVTYEFEDIINYDSCYWIKGLSHAYERDQEKDPLSGRCLIKTAMLNKKKSSNKNEEINEDEIE